MLIFKRPQNTGRFTILVLLNGELSATGESIEIVEPINQGLLSGDDIGFKNFYNMDKYYLSSSALKINKIASVINVPRETVRRKRDKLIKDKILILDKKKRVITLNTDKIDRRILDLQIENLTKFLSKFTDYFISNNFISKMITREQIKRDLDKKLLNVTKNV